MIFNLFKAKPTLKELIPEGFVDIHSHILPGIDDGAKKVSESLNLITEMNQIGISKIIGTPHTYKGLYDNTTKTIESSYNLIKNELDDSIHIKYASEYLIDETVVEKAKKNSLLTIKDNLVLIEMSFAGPPNDLFNLIFQIRLCNYVPVLAHPERYRFWFNDKSKFKKLKKMGCKFQINLFSLIGYYGNDITSFSETLLKDKMIDFVGSDIHNLNQIKLFEHKIKISEIKKIESVIESNITFFK